MVESEVLGQHQWFDDLVGIDRQSVHQGADHVRIVCDFRIEIADIQRADDTAQTLDAGADVGKAFLDGSIDRLVVTPDRPCQFSLSGHDIAGFPGMQRTDVHDSWLQRIEIAGQNVLDRKQDLRGGDQGILAEVRLPGMRADAFKRDVEFTVARHQWTLGQAENTFRQARIQVVTVDFFDLQLLQDPGIHDPFRTAWPFLSGLEDQND